MSWVVIFNNEYPHRLHFQLQLPLRYVQTCTSTFSLFKKTKKVKNRNLCRAQTIFRFLC